MKVKHLLWLDGEMTGSGRDHEVGDDMLIEVAVILTTIDLEVIGSLESVIQPPRNYDWQARLEATEVVLKMHIANGLVGDLLAGMGKPAVEVEDSIMELLAAHKLTKGRRVRLAGGGVCHFDRKFIRAEMPILDRALDYKSHDVGDLRRFISDVCGRYDLLPDDDPKPKSKSHRAMADVEQHLAEARHYKSLIETVIL